MGYEGLSQIQTDWFIHQSETEDGGLVAKLSLAAVGSWLLTHGFTPVGSGGYASISHVLRGPIVGCDPKVPYHEYQLPEGTAPHYEAFIREALHHADGLTLLATEEALREIVKIEDIKNVRLQEERDLLYILAEYNGKPVKMIKATNVELN